MDPRPAMSATLSRLRAGAEPQWITWHGRRLRLARPDAAWLAQGEGYAVISTRRGFRTALLRGRFGPTRKRGGPSIVDDCLQVITDKRIRAVILEEHPR